MSPRLPSYRRKLTVSADQIKVLSLADLPDTDPDHYGLSGSPTQVERIFPPAEAGEKVMLTGENLGTSAS